MRMGLTPRYEPVRNRQYLPTVERLAKTLILLPGTRVARPGEARTGGAERRLSCMMMSMYKRRGTAGAVEPLELDDAATTT